MRVLVCGGRNYFDRRALYAALDAIHSVTPITVMIIGGSNGADQLAHDWAGWRQVRREVYPADWERLGKSAGPIRNQMMIDEGQPEMVVAFEGGRGTADMVRRAHEACIKVIRP